MKVLMINGSRNAAGCTFTALSEIAKELNAEGIDTEIFHVGKDAVDGKVNEMVQVAIEKMKESEGLIIGSPVYYASPSGEVIAFLDRFFGAGSQVLRHKPAAAIASARRAGTTATLDVLNKYLQYSEMPLVTTNYWPMVHGNVPSEVMQDKEGIQTMHVLGKNMAWILKCIEAGKKAGVEEPEKVDKIKTNFIR
ncbi:Multimeric flavodoxin WrbA [Oribacterium sp. KHPX15]|uniref:flavodoxin family protein n=1 Tax=unclassified Oribacterium TaxID=2629782 RepID=UPI0004E1FECF|nr:MULTISPECIES: flavodoxin family protein [unclassified Oribacterium]SEA82771.1 Multimeric flavodoxin WrbA [Oribacterium sp. KHPX15]